MMVINTILLYPSKHSCLRKAKLRNVGSRTDSEQACYQPPPVLHPVNNSIVIIETANTIIEARLISSPPSA